LFWRGWATNAELVMRATTVAPIISRFMDISRVAQKGADVHFGIAEVTGS
jgi:hypothetical protein